MTGPLRMVGGDGGTDAVCADTVCAVPTTSAPPEPEAKDGADEA